MEKIRSFISLDINNEVKKEIEYYIKKNNLIDIFEGAKWVDLENIHLTLAFLGDISKDSIPLLENIISELARNNNPFLLKLCKFGFFPNHRRAKVFWIGMENSHQLLKLKTDLDYKLDEIGLNYDVKPFRPHLTLARFRYPFKFDTIRYKQKLNISTSFEANNINLVKSELFNTGPKYTNIFSCELKK